MQRIDWNARLLGMKLGLGDIAPRRRCMGYRNACVCAGCMVREKRQRRKVKQPWEVAA